MPIKSLSAMQASFLTSKNGDENRLATKKEQRINDELCAEVNFITQSVVRGQIMVFNAAVAHAGSENKGDADRIVVYALFSPSPVEGQGDEQRYPLGTER